MSVVSLVSAMANESLKDVIINLRVKPEIREQFKLAAELKGASVSGLLHQFIVKTIREEKEREPDAFNNISGKELATKSKNKMPFRKSAEDKKQKAA